MKKALILVILDGWGVGRDDESNPVHMVNPQNFKFLEETYPVTSLQASGISVGLPWGEVGNSEVGHLTIGAGKVLYQHFPRITIAIRDGTFFENPALKAACAHARKNGGTVNFAGLLSKGNVHASLEHLQALIKAADQENVQCKLHLFADGKDSAPFTLKSFLDAIPREKIASLTGRYYAMDRERNWSLTEKAYETLLGRGGRLTAIADLDAAIEAHYKTGSNEEFLPPLRFGEQGGIKERDAVVFFNYREDSIRQIAEAFILPEFDKFPIQNTSGLFVAPMTRYEEQFTVPVLFPAGTIEHPLGKILADAGKVQIRIAETYKYAHVTYFFNGYVEPPFPNEYRVLIPSQTATRVEKHPEMMASSITDRVLQSIESQSFDFILVNYANPDTVAHTGNYDAALAAVKTIDTEIGRLVKTAIAAGAPLIITSDHGNIEELINPMTATPETQHDPSPVPFYIVANEVKGKKFPNHNSLSQPIGMLSDIAPTILALMGLPPSDEMTGRNLLRDIA